MSKKLISKFSYAVRGIIDGFKYENTLKFHLIFGCLVILISIILKVNYIEFCILLLLIGLVIVAEMINTMFEIYARHIFKKNDYYVRMLLDIAAGAVLITSIFAATIGVIILGPKLLNFISYLFGS